MRNKTGGRQKGTPNKVSTRVKEKLINIIDECIDSIDVQELYTEEKIKLIQIGLQYITPKLRDVQKETIDNNKSFEVQVVDSKELKERLDNYEKQTELDENKNDYDIRFIPA